MNPNQPNEPNLDARLAEHPMFSPSDLVYLRQKGYSDPQILAFWDRDHAMGKAPCQHDWAPDEAQLQAIARAYLGVTSIDARLRTALLAAYALGRQAG